MCLVNPSRTQGLQCVQLFDGCVVWHGNEAAAAKRGTHQGEADASAPGRALGDEAAWAQAPCAHGLAYHFEGYAVLDTTTGVEKLCLGQDLGKRAGQREG